MKPDLKKLIITNLPYLLFVWLLGKVGEAWRLAAGTDLTQKMKCSPGLRKRSRCISPSGNTKNFCFPLAKLVPRS